MEPHTPDSEIRPPLIVPRPEHTLSRKNVSVEALKVLYRLHHAGYKAYLVGGSVRDLLLGKQPKDFDIATDARPGEIRKLFRNSRIIGRRFRLVQVFFRGGKIVEVSTFRCRSEFDDTSETPVDARHNTFGTPAEDAQRRDLTINGLFYNIADFSLVDYVGGLEDLRRGIIRVIGDPAVRFVRDPMRMLRVLRHAARTGFAIEPRAWEELTAKPHLIRLCAPARIRDELLRDFKSGAARPFFELMFKSGLFYAILPHWQGRLGEQGEKRLLDLFSRIDLLTRHERPVSETLFWAALLIPFLEKEVMPENLKDVREFFREKGREALGPIEFPRQRGDEVAQTLALAVTIASFLKEERPIPARTTRLSAFPEAYRLYQLTEAPEEELLQIFSDAEVQLPPAAVRRRRPRRRRFKKKGRRLPRPQ
ncbi:MAG: poly(A) polymerase [Deltaproteobacteria bacterium]|nr:poly(A) polymerase [Deltaproteobacteria bacterium]